MRIAFQHANPSAGNESFLLRFTTPTDEDNPCILVDAGYGTNLDTLLQPDDYLAAICLTHAHLDHYSELTAAHRDSAPIFTSPATSALLEDVFDVASKEYDVVTTESVTDAITPIDSWTTVTPTIDIHPVPAGHIPGAVGVLIRVSEGDEKHHLLTTGDFTNRRAGGYPGFDADSFVDIDVLFLNVATNERFEESLTEALGTALEHAQRGAPTLVATSGVFGAQVAYLLAALTEEFDVDVPIRVVGQVAKLYDALEYDYDQVEPIPFFTDPRECLDPGAITLAGPEVPRERSSGRLFGRLRNNPNGCVIQLIGSGEDPITRGKCTIHDYELVNHPPSSSLAAVNDAINPRETVITHSHRGASGTFNELSSTVWASGDREEYVLYDDERWQMPPWMSSGGAPQQAGQGFQQFAGGDLLDALSLPSLERHARPDLEAEGIETDKIASRLHRESEVETYNATSQSKEDGIASEETEDGSTVTMTQNDNSTDEEAEAESTSPTELYNTVKSGVSDESAPDPPEMPDNDETSISPKNLVSLQAARKMAEEQTEESSENSSESQEGSEPEEPDEPTQGGDVENHDDVSEEDTVPESDEDHSGEDESETHDSGEEQSEDKSGIEDAVTGREESASADTTKITLNPLVATMAKRAAEKGDRTPEAFVDEAIQYYLSSLLRGDASGDEDEQFSIDFDVSPLVERVLTETLAIGDEFEEFSELAAVGAAFALGEYETGTLEVTLSEEYLPLLDATVANSNHVFTSRRGVIETAVAWYIPETDGIAGRASSNPE